MVETRPGPARRPAAGPVAHRFGAEITALSQLAGRFDEVSEQDFDWLFSINFHGVVRMTRAFLPLLKHFNIDPVLWGTLVFVNLQAAFLSPPVAMSAFYLKGVAPSHVTLNQIFNGMMPYMAVIVVCMIIMYIWPGMTLWLPNYLYGR